MKEDKMGRNTNKQEMLFMQNQLENEMDENQNPESYEIEGDETPELGEHEREYFDISEYEGEID